MTYVHHVNGSRSVTSSILRRHKLLVVRFYAIATGKFLIKCNSSQIHSGNYYIHNIVFFC